METDRARMSLDYPVVGDIFPMSTYMDIIIVGVFGDNIDTL